MATHHTIDQFTFDGRKYGRFEPFPAPGVELAATQIRAMENARRIAIGPAPAEAIAKEEKERAAREARLKAQAAATKKPARAAPEMTDAELEAATAPAVEPKPARRKAG